MDPISIASGSIGLVVSCATITDHIKTYVTRVKNVDETIRVLDIEIKELSRVLGSIKLKETDDSVVVKPTETLTRDEKEYWKNVARAMTDCQNTLGKLAGILQTVNSGMARNSIIRRVSLNDKLQGQSNAISTLKAEISAYRQTLELSLHLITVSSQLRSERLNTNLGRKLDKIGVEIKQLRQTLINRRQTVGGFNIQAMSNLEVCVRSAQDFVKTATSIFSTQSSLVKSGEDGLTEQKREEVTEWLTSRIDVASSEVSPLVVESVTNRTVVGYDHGNVENMKLLKMAIAKYNAQDYDRAKKYLETLWVRSEAREHNGISITERNQILEMLGTIYCRSADWEGAEKILQIDFDGQEQATKRLVLCYYQLGKLDDAERILSKAIEADAVYDKSETSYYKDTSWKWHLQAEVYLARKKYDEGIESCNKALQEVLRTLGEDHIQYYMSVSLLARIYTAKGDEVGADINHELLPKGIEVCHDIDKLSRMWPEHAANDSESTLSPHINLPVPWNEIKENIRKGNVIGSGCGYTLLHAFVEGGDELAVRLLLFKGADINAITNANGYTALHLAIRSQNSSLVASLLKSGADPLAQDKDQMTPWGLAISLGNEEIVRTLARDIDISGQASGGATPAKPLMLAIEYENDNFFEFLVHSGAEIEAQDSNGATPLLKAVECGKMIASVNLLLSKGANVNAKNNQGVTPLMRAAEKGSVETVRLLLDKKPDLEIMADDKTTALFIAAKRGFKSIVEMLLSAGAECVAGYPPGGTPQHVASNFEIMKALQIVRMKRKKWHQKISKDELDELYEMAMLMEICGGKLPDQPTPGY